MGKSSLKKLTAALLTLAVLSALITGCKNSSNTSSGAQGNLNTAKVINVGDQPAFFLFKIAQAKGFFTKELGSKIKVNVISYVKQGPAVVESMASKDVDLAMLGTLPTVTADANGDHIIALASGNYSKDGFTLFVSPASGAKKVEDLKGKSVGVPFGTNDHEVAVEILAKHHLKTSDVQLTNMQASDALIALKKGEIDAALLKGNDYYTAVSDGEIAIANNGETGPVANLIVGRKAFIEKNPKLTEQFLKACSEAAKYVESHADESIKIAAKVTGTTTEDSKINYKSRIRLVSISDKYFATPLQKTIKFAKDQSLIDKDISLKDITDTSYFKNAGLK